MFREQGMCSRYLCIFISLDQCTLYYSDQYTVSIYCIVWYIDQYVLIVPVEISVCVIALRDCPSLERYLTRGASCYVVKYFIFRNVLSLICTADLPPVRRAKAQGVTLFKTRFSGDYQPYHCTAQKCFSQDTIRVSQVNNSDGVYMAAFSLAHVNSHTMHVLYSSSTLYCRMVFSLPFI